VTGRVLLIGDPVGHSVSPAMQRAAFQAAGLDWRYEAVRISAGNLGRSWARLRTDPALAGLNVTIPHKEAVIPLLDRVDPGAQASGSVNAVAFESGRAVGHSTDGVGFLSALARVDGRARRRAVVLGTGGAARAVAAALRELGSHVTVVGRNSAAGKRLANDLGVAFTPLGSSDALEGALDGADLLANATPVGTGDPEASPLPPDVELQPETTVFDLVYRPRRTALLERAAATGCRTVEGIEMLIEQGARSFELWTALAAPVEAMRAAANAALNGRAG
jgi:shikimate dehydrogenase